MSTILIRYALNHRWALDPSVLRSLCAIVNRHLAGEKVGEEQLAEVRARRRAEHPFRRMAGGRAWTGVRPVAYEDDAEEGGAPEPYLCGRALVVPVRGVICQYANMVNGASQPQGMAAERLVEICREARQDRSVASVVLHVDSPGGSVAGISDAVAAVRDLAAEKPVFVHANDLMASAALWLGSQGTELSVTASGMVGSIGVYAVVEDTSEYYAERGVRRILIASGEHKGAGTDGVPVTDGQIEGIAQECMALSAVFMNDVAAGRGMSLEAVRALADGRTFVGEEARRLGLVDRVCGLDEVIESAQGAIDPARSYGSRTRTPMSTSTKTDGGATITQAGPKAADPATQPDPKEDPKDGPAPDPAADPKEDAAPTLAELKEQYPDQMAEHAEEVRKSLQVPMDPEEDPACAGKAATIAQIKAAFPDDPAFRALCLEEGLTLAEAQGRYIASLRKQLADSKAQAERVKPKAAGADPAPFSPAGSGQGPQDYAAAVKAIEARDKVKREVAMSRAASAHPELHKAWVKAGCPAIA